MMCRERIYSLLRCCKGLAEARHAHLLMLSTGLHSVSVLADHLIRLFASFDSLLEAQLAFCGVPQPSVFTWHSVIAAHAALGRSETAIHLYFKLHSEGVRPDKFIFTCVLKACADAGSIDLGIHIHNLIVECSLETDEVVGSAIILLYSRCGASNDATKIFAMLINRNAVSWNTLISLCIESDDGDTALQFYDKMQQHGIKPEVSTFSTILKACANMGALDQGKLIHEKILRSGLESDAIVGSSLIDMYSKCGSLKLARDAFEKIPNRDVVAWGSMISSYTENGHPKSALELFAKLLQEDIIPNEVVLVCVVKACASVGSVEESMCIHHHIISVAAESGKVLGSTVVDAYIWCGCLNEALKVFSLMGERDVVSWNVMIGGYAEHELGKQALLLYAQMQKSAVNPDKITFLGVSKACGITGASCLGRMMHHQIVKDGFDSDFSIASALVDMYAKCASLQEAHSLFHKLSDKNIMSWGALLGGYAQLGNHDVVDQCLRNMIQEGLTPNPVIYINLFASCSHAGRVEDGKKYFNAMIIAHGFTASEEHFNSMIDVFSRAGCLNEGKKLLQSMPVHITVTCWMSLLVACGTYGDIDLARECFDELVRIDPDHASAYILMSKIYTNMNMWEHADRITHMEKAFSRCKRPAALGKLD